MLLFTYKIKKKYGRRLSREFSKIPIKNNFYYPKEYLSKDKVIKDKIMVQYGTGRCFFLKDENEQIYVALTSSKFTLPKINHCTIWQKIDKEAIIYDKVEIKRGELIIIGKEVKIPETNKKTKEKK